MTLFRAPWALDGAHLPSALARAATFSTSGGVAGEGVVSGTHFKVSQLAVAGNGLLVSGGSALVVNRYQTDPNQTYTVFNDGEVTLDSTFMPPPAAGTAQSHLLCVTVGDPEFSQAGHPWMPSTAIPVEQRLEYNYVRFYVIRNVPAGTTKFSQLGFNYPAYALARLDIPAGTTNITGSMIVDLRNVAAPKSSAKMLRATGPASQQNIASINSYEIFPNTATWAISIPSWATTAKVMGFVEGLILSKAGTGSIRVGFAAGGATQLTDLWEQDFANRNRSGYNVGGEIPIPLAYRGTTQTLRFEASVTASASQGFLSADVKSGAQILVIFEEAAA